MPISPTVALTGTGLDQLIDIIANDAKLAQGTSSADIQGGIEAAAAMNGLIIQAIKATGVADDGHISALDVVAINDNLVTNHYDLWVELHGDDEYGVETGFHLVQNDGAKTLLYGVNAVDRVADSIYHLGFQMTGRSRLTNEDGDANQSIYQVSDWLNLLLADDLANGSLNSGKVGTNDLILSISNGGEPDAFQDPDFVPYYDDDLSAGNDDVAGGAGADVFRFQYNINTTPDVAANNLNPDDTINWSMVAQQNDYTHQHWVDHGGDDTILDYAKYEGDTIELVGHTVNFWLSTDDVDGNGTQDTIINVYSDQGGYDVDANGNFTGSANGAHDGDSLGTITVLNATLTADEISVTRNVFYGEYDTVDQMPDPDNVPVPPVPPADDQVTLTGTGLDDLVDIILTDTKLAQGTSQQDILDGAATAGAMNAILVEAIMKTGSADDGEIQASDIVAMNAYILDTYSDRWVDLHGNDDNGVESGFNLVYGDGNRTLLYGSNAVDKVADAIYHIGFEMTGRSILSDEDGNANESIYDVAEWMNELLAGDLADGSLIV